jgi:hypothetical protein
VVRAYQRVRANPGTHCAIGDLSKAAKLPKKNDSPRKPKIRDNKWAWKDVLPKAGEPKTKEFEGKQYHVNCPYHPNQWVCHYAKECSKNPEAASDAATPDAAPSSTPNARRLKAAKLAAAGLAAEGGSGDESQSEDYWMAGRRIFLTLCWPTHQCLSTMLAEFFPVVFLELLAFLVCAEATLWVLDGSPSVPTIDTYVPRAKRPPSYLKPLLHWLSVTIDRAADKLAPCVNLKRRPRNFSTSRPTVPPPVTQVKGLHRISDLTRPEIAYAVHQCARFSANPRQSHANAIKYLCRYLMATKDKGLILRPDVSRSFEVHVDCNFAGNWVKEDAMEDPSTAKSRTGYVISYGGCPIIWASKLQTKVVLSSTESKYVGLSESLRVTIGMMRITPRHDRDDESAE